MESWRKHILTSLCVSCVLLVVALSVVQRMETKTFNTEIPPRKQTSKQVNEESEKRPIRTEVQPQKQKMKQQQKQNENSSTEIHPAQPEQMRNTINSTSFNMTLSEFKVPNIVHYIWYADEPIEFRFDKALSILSAIKNLKPEAVYFYTNSEPYGEHFQMLKKINIFQVVHREPPRDVFNKTFFETDYSDYDRVKILIERGGIYLDLDVMVVRSMDDLRRYACTLGYEDTYKICGGIILCAPNHPFLYVWLNSYYENFKGQWSYNSGKVSYYLVKRYPELIHTEWEKLNRPNWVRVDYIFGKKRFAWRENYTVHTWIRIAIRRKLIEYPTPESIKTMNSTYGEIAREVYYGSTDLIL